MNCQSFENVVNDLARNQIMEAGLREVALRHSSDCAHCAERLDDERQLTKNLRQVADAMKSSHASPAMESSLLAEFRTHSTAARVQLQAASVRRRNRFALYATPVAAIFLIALGVFVIRFRGVEGVQPEMPGVEISNAGLLPPRHANIVMSQPIESSLAGLVSNANDARAPKTRRVARAAKSTVTVEITKLVAVNNPEISSEFIPIGYSTASNVQEGGQLVRVELSRSTMAQFGFSVNMERYDERVKADVWVGVDGLARAIRFVQEPSK